MHSFFQTFKKAYNLYRDWKAAKNNTEYKIQMHTQQTQTPADVTMYDIGLTQRDVTMGETQANADVTMQSQLVAKPTMDHIPSRPSTESSIQEGEEKEQQQDEEKEQQQDEGQEEQEEQEVQKKNELDQPSEYFEV